MNKSPNYITNFFHWVVLIFKKWWWLIGLPLPLLRIFSFYIPNFPQLNISWQISIIIGVCGFFISAFLVYLDQQFKLDAFLVHEPQYSIQIIDYSQKICEGDRIHIDCSVRIICNTIWVGVLENISLESNRLPNFIGIGEISDKDYQPLDWHNQNMLKLPYKIPQNGVDVILTIHYSYDKGTELDVNKNTRHAKMILCFLIGYECPTIGIIQKCERVALPLDINSLPKLIEQHREELRQKES